MQADPVPCRHCEQLVREKDPETAVLYLDMAHKRISIMELCKSDPDFNLCIQHVCALHSAVSPVACADALPLFQVACSNLTGLHAPSTGLEVLMCGTAQHSACKTAPYFGQSDAEEMNAFSHVFLLECLQHPC